MLAFFAACFAWFDVPTTSAILAMLGASVLWMQRSRQPPPPPTLSSRPNELVAKTAEASHPDEEDFARSLSPERVAKRLKRSFSSMSFSSMSQRMHRRSSREFQRLVRLQSWKRIADESFPRITRMPSFKRMADERFRSAQAAASGQLSRLKRGVERVERGRKHMSPAFRVKQKFGHELASRLDGRGSTMRMHSKLAIDGSRKRTRSEGGRGDVGQLSTPALNWSIDKGSPEPSSDVAWSIASGSTAGLELPSGRVPYDRLHVWLEYGEGLPARPSWWPFEP